MFNLFKKKTEEIVIGDIKATVEGKCIDITEVNDNVFSSKMMGDGIAIIPTSNIVYSPCSGEITMLFPTKHAFGIKCVDGSEIMVHIGLDTVNLNGVGFKSFVKKGEKIKTGKKMIEFKRDYLRDKNLDMTVITIITNANGVEYNKNSLNKDVLIDDTVLAKKMNI